jgi:hypothetical protein
MYAEYTDEDMMIPQNTTVLVRRIAGQLSENIVLVSSYVSSNLLFHVLNYCHV